MKYQIIFFIQFFHSRLKNGSYQVKICQRTKQFFILLNILQNMTRRFKEKIWGAHQSSDSAEVLSPLGRVILFSKYNYNRKKFNEKQITTISPPHALTHAPTLARPGQPVIHHPIFIRTLPIGRDGGKDFRFPDFASYTGRFRLFTQNR